MDLPSQINALKVSVFGDGVGYLDQPAQFRFCYEQPLDQHNIRPVSLTMAARSEPYQHGALHPIYG